MTTGIQSSATLRPAAAPVAPTVQTPAVNPPPEAPQVLRSGEQVATSVEALADPESKTYYNIVPGSNFTMPDGLNIRFLGGRYVTNKPEEIAQLDAVANRVGSLIYTRAEVKQADEQLAKLAAAETITSDGTGTGPLVPDAK